MWDKRLKLMHKEDAVLPAGAPFTPHRLKAQHSLSAAMKTLDWWSVLS